MTKNLYIVEEVLWDYTPGMVLIIASNLDECRKIYFGEDSQFSNEEEYDEAIKDKNYKVVPVGDNEESRIVSYVYGGT